MQELFSMSFPIASYDIEEAEKTLKRLQKKAEAYGATLQYSVGSEYLFEQRINSTLPATCKPVSHIVAQDIGITCEVIKAWQDCKILAYLEHVEEGKNIVTCIGDAVPSASWYSMAGNCEHCNTIRFRSATWILQNNQTGKQIQVGRQCLKDYMGIDPSFILQAMELQKEIEAMATDGGQDDEEFFRSGCSGMEPEKPLAYAIACIAAFGYRKSSDFDSTKNQVFDAMFSEKNDSIKPTESDKEKAKTILQWLKVQEIDPMSDNLLYTCKVLADTGICKYKHVGYLAYLPIAYEKAMDREAQNKVRQAENEKQATVSSYIGNEGERLEIDIVSCLLITSWETQFGITRLYKMFDAIGNVYIWFASSFFEFKQGRIKATIKGHDERGGIKQTILTRVKAM